MALHPDPILSVRENLPMAVPRTLGVDDLAIVAGRLRGPSDSPKYKGLDALRINENGELIVIGAHDKEIVDLLTEIRDLLKDNNTALLRLR